MNGLMCFSQSRFPLHLFPYFVWCQRSRSWELLKSAQSLRYINPFSLHLYCQTLPFFISWEWTFDDIRLKILVYILPKSLVDLTLRLWASNLMVSCITLTSFCLLFSLVLDNNFGLIIRDWDCLPSYLISHMHTCTYTWLAIAICCCLHGQW